MIKPIRFTLIFLVIATFGACSNSDDSSNVEIQKNKFISKITAKSLDYNDKDEKIILTTSSVFNYLNGKVNKITTSDNNVIKFNYLGEKIISLDYNNQSSAYTYFYNENVLTELNSDETKIEFFYDSNNKLKEELSSYITSNFTEKYSKKFYFVGNNIDKINDNHFIAPYSSEVSYKYDTKNNPFKNHNIYFRIIFGFENSRLSENNVIEETDKDKVIKYTIIYDSDNFPIKITGINQNTNELWTEYSFEYTEI